MGAIKSDRNGILRNEKGYFLEGHAPKSPGRPKGSKSIKDAVRQYLVDHPKDFQEYVKHFIIKNRELSWQMLEGKPAQATDLTSGGEKLTFGVINFDDYDTVSTPTE